MQNDRMRARAVSLKRILFRSRVFLEKRLEKRYLSFNDEQKKKALKLWYWIFRKEWIDIDHPKNFSEKMQWLKIYDATEKKEILSDKYRVRDWISRMIGENYLIPLIGAWDSADDIDFNTLPNQFVLKANHGSGMNLVVTDKSKIDIKKTRRLAANWLKTPCCILSVEQQYYYIPRKIIAEEYIEQMDGDLLDYKIHCFQGIPKFIQIIGNRKESHHEKARIKEAYVDLNWEKIDYLRNRYSLYEEVPPKPSCYDDMIRVAQTLSKDFYYVRVDLYVINDHVKFGEMTFTPAQGIGWWTRKIPEEWWKES